MTGDGNVWVGIGQGGQSWGRDGGDTVVKNRDGDKLTASGGYTSVSGGSANGGDGGRGWSGGGGKACGEVAGGVGED